VAENPHQSRTLALERMGTSSGKPPAKAIPPAPDPEGVSLRRRYEISLSAHLSGKATSMIGLCQEGKSSPRLVRFVNVPGHRISCVALARVPVALVARAT